MWRFRFRENAKIDQVKTSIENGVLTVIVPKAEVKKPVVKPIQITGKPTLPTNFEEVTWAKLKSAICGIFLKQPESCDLEKLYQAVSDLCIYKMAGNLYQRIEMECEAHISTALQSLVGQSPDLTKLQEEHDRCLIYLDASTRKSLIATAEKQLLECYIPAILDKFDHSISDNIGETEGEIGGHVLCAIDMSSFKCCLHFSFF
ncbi:hypothetical protein AHAS_Ahas19G0318200 [Arachis hypogaea]